MVAADKGTATFSDYANGISKEYGFWLGDAFASGGSAGYDHKVMGITARGAWESVKRHFREMGVDTQTTDFTVAGIGDMSGDVFGNGMLLSRHIRLVAAFDHRHIFLDPDPDAAASFAERERMFKLPRSSWADYDAKLLSGGRRHPCAEREIDRDHAAGQGGARHHRRRDDADRAGERDPQGAGRPDLQRRHRHVRQGRRARRTRKSATAPTTRLRVNGRELRCKVFAEGGNLGCTQLGRIEYALAGGRINTDAIDNSAGVDTSDHEVNIKILLGLPITDGELTEKQRNALLAEMTDDVAALVLRDNYFQTQAALGHRPHRAAVARCAGSASCSFSKRPGSSTARIEFLPSDDEIAERRAQRHAD